MEKRDNIRELLGITQLEMAMLLKISRAQWSMYESGKRSLPTAALILLGNIKMQLMNSEARDFKALPSAIHQENEKRKVLEALLKENQYQLLKVTRKIATSSKKYEAHIRMLQLTDFLASSQEITEPMINTLKAIETTAKKGIDKTGLPLLKFRIHQAILEKEALVLKAALDEI
ncbi:helix-turn-helix domain-containing protein [Flavobacterium sp. UBA7682]|uniref:helix-turn-helix domain-containing protein n=1 Tax=Flavobacterium sp. UBA7682 TaxID=1946560 RepID=UPI0025BBB2A7|nr:helix-turn-helix transcriptional regulator [Flavobacterium sp. UBA7682]